MIEKGQQLQQVIEDVGLLLLNAQDVGRMEGLGPVHFQLLVEREEPELEEVLDNNGDLSEEGQMR